MVFGKIDGVNQALRHKWREIGPSGIDYGKRLRVDRVWLDGEVFGMMRIDERDGIDRHERGPS